MKKCLVIGGGIAGLSAATYLIKNNFQVELIDASPKLGGRAYSFSDKATNKAIDNGQHILMGCYDETFKFLKLIGAFNKLKLHNYLDVSFIDDQQIQHSLKANLFFYPLNILLALLKYSALSFDERIRVILFAIKLFLINPNSIKEENIRQWLLKNLQTEKINKALWEIIAVGALNSSLDKSSPKIFANILKKIFFSGNFSSTIVLSKVGLSDLFCAPTETFFDETNNKIFCSEKLIEVSIEDERVIKVKTNKREITEFDHLILSLPFFGIEKIVGLPDNLYSGGRGLDYSSILGCHIFIKDFQLEKDFYALLNSSLHWVFNHKSHLTIVISDADYLIKKSNEEINRIIFTELHKYLGLEEKNILSSKIIKEKRATFIPDQKSIRVRPSTKTSITNLFLAGDWIQTGLPATIESAVLSGRLAAEAIINKHEN